MKILVKICLLLFLCPHTIIYANEHSIFNQEDITYIRESISKNNLSLKVNGSFMDFKTYSPTKVFLEKQIKKQGIVYIFPNETIYVLFNQYLKKINNNPQTFVDKDEKYKKGKTIYIFTLSSVKEKMLIHINENVYVEDFGYAEQSYMYCFEKIDGKIVLSEINAAG